MVALFIIQGNRNYLTTPDETHSCDILRSKLQCCASKSVGNRLTKIGRRRKQANRKLWEKCRSICACVRNENLMVIMEVAKTPPYAFFIPECESSPSIKAITNTHSYTNELVVDYVVSVFEYR